MLLTLCKCKIQIWFLSEKWHHFLTFPVLLISWFRSSAENRGLENIDISWISYVSCFCWPHVYHRILTSADIQKGVWTALYVSPACFPCPQCFMVILIEFPVETESPLVLWEDCTPKMSARRYSELWCGGEVAQMQSIQQTGFLGIRQGKKKHAAGLRCLFPVWFLLSHTQGKACGSVHYPSRLREQQ